MFFDASDYVASESVPEAQYDTVMCLSTVKWIHLNGGDAAVKRYLILLLQTLLWVHQNLPFGVLSACSTKFIRRLCQEVLFC